MKFVTLPDTCDHSVGIVQYTMLTEAFVNVRNLQRIFTSVNFNE